MISLFNYKTHKFPYKAKDEMFDEYGYLKDWQYGDYACFRCGYYLCSSSENFSCDEYIIKKIIE